MACYCKIEKSYALVEYIVSNGMYEKSVFTLFTI
jgi:hypothetical protein